MKLNFSNNSVTHAGGFPIILRKTSILSLISLGNPLMSGNHSHNQFNSDPVRQPNSHVWHKDRSLRDTEIPIHLLKLDS